MTLALIDAIGPFFRGYDQRRINWSKIPFAHLATEGRERTEQWQTIRADMEIFARRVAALGYNAVSLDDLYHITAHVWYEPEIRRRIHIFAEEFRILFRIIAGHGLAIYLTADYLSVSAAVHRQLEDDLEKSAAYFGDLLHSCLSDFPEVAGVILRIGESDGHDVTNPLRSRLLMRTASQVNLLLRQILPIFEKNKRTLIFRTWTVGAYLVGDLIWHRGRLASVFEGVSSPALIVSMKYGESDFFRYLPLNRHFFRLTLPTIIELQARREYEGAGEYPAFVGWEIEKFAAEISAKKNIVGFSVWCQTGGWHAFRRLAFLEKESFWIELNAAVIVRQLRHRQSVAEAITAEFGPIRAPAVLELLRLADETINCILYLAPFARQKLYFRRVRIPPLLHVYWDCLFINDGVRKLMSLFIPDPKATIQEGEAAFAHFAQMETLAESANLPGEDIRFMRDTFWLILLARRYYLLPSDPALEQEIRAAKAAYKIRWPRPTRQRYRIRLSFEPGPIQQRTLARLIRLLVRKRRGYRSLLDRLFTIYLLSWSYRLFRSRKQDSIPKLMRETAMGLDSLFR